MPTATLNEQFAALEAEARTKWRTWAAAIAAGDPPPAPQEILQAALALRITDPGLALEADAAALRKVQSIEARRAADAAAREAELQAHGGARQITAKIEKLREQLRDLERLASGWAAIAAGHAVAEAVAIKRRHPRIFAA